MKKTILFLLILIIFVCFISGCSPEEKTCEELRGYNIHSTLSDCPKDMVGMKVKDTCKSCVCCVPK